MILEGGFANRPNIFSSTKNACHTHRCQQPRRHHACEEPWQQTRLTFPTATSLVLGCLISCVRKTWAFGTDMPHRSPPAFVFDMQVNISARRKRAMTHNLSLALLAAGVFSLAGAASAQCPVPAPVYQEARVYNCQTCTTPSNTWAVRPGTGVQYQVPNYPTCPPAPVYESCAPCAVLPHSWSHCWTW